MCKNIIIYGKGKIFSLYKEYFKSENVIAIVDRAAKLDEVFDGIPVMTPDKISTLTYDYVVICTTKYFEEIQQTLIGDYFVPTDKIRYWRSFVDKSGLIGENAFNILNLLIRDLDVKSILDMNISYLTQFLYSEDMLGTEDIVIEGIGEQGYASSTSLYNNIYNTINECKKLYDAVLIWSNFDKIDVIAEFIASRYFLIISPEKEWIHDSLERFGSVRRFATGDGTIWVIDRMRETEIDSQKDKNIKIYVVTHKAYNVLDNDLYQPICVGNNYQVEKYLSDKTGENIAYLNEKINECTAIYWIWKNVDVDIVGINHYRRYFYNNEIKIRDNILDKNTINKILMDYDIIVPNRYITYDISMKEVISNGIGIEVFEKGEKCILNALRKYQPDYIEAYKDVMNGHEGFMFNMFVTRKEIYDRYCQWLFSFLIEAAEQMDISNYGTYSKRVIGFFAERMLTVWLMKEQYRVKELPYFRIGV